MAVLLTSSKTLVGIPRAQLDLDLIKSAPQKRRIGLVYDILSFRMSIPISVSYYPQKPIPVDRLLTHS